MRPGRFYMHEQGMDVAIEVLKSYRISANRYSLRVKWVNLGYTGTPWLVFGPERIEVTNPLSWRDVTSLIGNVRTESGVPKP